MSGSRASLILAFVVVVSISVLAALAHGWFTPQSTLQLVLNSNPALSPGVAARLKGFDIGRVDQVQLDDAGLVRVRLRIATRYLPLIPKDAVVHLARDGFIGAQYLEFAGGTVGAPRAAEGDEMHFDPGVDWNAQAAELLPRAQQIVANLQQLTDEMAAARGDLRQAAADLAVITGKARTDSGPILASAHDSVDHLARISADAQTTMSSLKGSVPPLVENLNATVISAKATADQAQATVHALGGLAGKLSQTLDQAQPDALRLLRSGREASEDAAGVLAGVRSAPLYRTLVSEPASPPASLDAYDDRLGK
jgi:ABC-type transporter Mla subunit MlaD